MSESLSIFSNQNCFVLLVIYLILINLIYFVPVRRVVPRRAFTNVFICSESSIIAAVSSGRVLAISLYLFDFC